MTVVLFVGDRCDVSRILFYSQPIAQQSPINPWSPEEEKNNMKLNSLGPWSLALRWALFGAKIVHSSAFTLEG